MGYNEVSRLFLPALSPPVTTSWRMDRALKRPAIFLILIAFFAGLAPAADKPSFTVGWSVYVGWNPYYYMAKSGILKKWAD